MKSHQFMRVGWGRVSNISGQVKKWLTSNSAYAVSGYTASNNYSYKPENLLDS